MSRRKAKSVEKTPAASRRPTGKTVTLSGTALRQGKYEMIVTSMNAKDLWALVKINRRSEDKDDGYQRALSVSRVNDIARYLEKGNAIPGAILVSFDAEHAQWDPSKSALRIENIEDAGWVIDGQHRLAGAHRATVEISVPVVAFVGLGLQQQIEMFVTINRNQKGVPTSLYYDLLAKLPRELDETETVQERANDLATELKRDDQSPFHARIVVTTSPKAGQISSTNFVRKLTPLLKRDGRLASFADKERTAILSNLYLALKQVFPKEYARTDSVFFRTIGFGALMNCLPQIMDATFRIAKELNFRVNAVEKTLRLVDDFDFDDWREMGTGTAAENNAAADFRLRLQDALDQSAAPGLQF